MLQSETDLQDSSLMCELKQRYFLIDLLGFCSKTIFISTISKCLYDIFYHKVEIPELVDFNPPFFTETSIAVSDHTLPK